MRKRLVGIVATSTLLVTPALAQTTPPVRASAAVEKTTDTAAVKQGTTMGRQSGTSQGVARGVGAGAGGGGMSSAALAGLALGLTGVALASYIALNKSSSPR